MVLKKNVRPYSWDFSKPDHSHEIKHWKQMGLDSDALQKRATAAKQDKPVTGSAIEEALKHANQESRKTDGLTRSLSVRDENTSFKDGPGVQTGENPVRTGRRIVGAFADMQQGEDLHILVGPELSIRNESGVEKSADNQPDSTLGLGMRFKLDF